MARMGPEKRRVAADGGTRAKGVGRADASGLNQKKEKHFK